MPKSFACRWHCSLLKIGSSGKNKLNTIQMEILPIQHETVDQESKNCSLEKCGNVARMLSHRKDTRGLYNMTYMRQQTKSSLMKHFFRTKT